MTIGSLFPGVSGEQSSADALCAHLKRALGLVSETRESSKTAAAEGSEVSDTHVDHVAVPSTGFDETEFVEPSPLTSHVSIHLPKSTVSLDASSSDVDSSVSGYRRKYLQKHPRVNPELLDRALSDCYGRFVALLPEEILRDHVHLCFYLRDAYWWYCDKWVIRHPEELGHMRFSNFISLVCRDCPLLSSYVREAEEKELISAWSKYNRRIPLRGGILLNEACDKILLVQSYQSKHWTFPRGKSDESEDDSACAVREILEEVGTDVSHLIHPDVYLAGEVECRNIKLFFVPGVSEDEKMRPMTDYEISDVKWVSFQLLEDIVNKRTPRFMTYHVKPFVRGILDLVQEFRSGNLREHFPIAYASYLRVRNSSAPRRPPLGDSQSVKRDKPVRQFDDHCKETFGESSGWSADEMFRVNREKFGVESTYKDATPEIISSVKSQRELIPFELAVGAMATVTTTIKTELCSFSDYRVYPGRGQKFVARDGKVYFFLSSKSASLHKQRVKPAKSWRKANKKFQTEVSHRRRSKKAARYQKAFLGLSLEELKAKRATAAKANAKMAMIAEAKEKAKKLKGANVKAPGAAQARQAAVPKKITKTAMRK
ncbi:mRNA-decapping enzyme subunit 2 [Babesia sp. Xinjiang]|uniref:mRNA-decapping enzyme subunit 2 n=1 Tax=Babesia sp. Xinjiang TaxID=462227 RepID=UPI000A22CE90|nr:mRNA-decapping enzyme subunit 2 [Babesia sp. Xinjiang]ORM41841.1 mRNA-decapping enzyme subunit 2 [Babesia sp. Xinjiang]